MFGHIKNTPITHTLIFTCLNSVRFKGTIGSYTFLQIKKLLLIQKSLFQPCFPSLFSLVRTRARAEIYKSLWELNPVCIQTFIINTNFSDHSITHLLLCTTLYWVYSRWNPHYLLKRNFKIRFFNGPVYLPYEYERKIIFEKMTIKL